MVTLFIIAVLLFCLMLLYVKCKYGTPSMISSIYYLFGNHGWIFQLIMIVIGLLMMVILLDSGLGKQYLAFLACTGLIFVGAAPRFLESGEREVHKSAAILSAVASVAWCLSVNVTQTFIAIALYLLFGTRRHPLYWAEVTAILLVF